MKYVIGDYRIKKIGEKNLLVANHGKWAVLDDLQLKKLESFELSSEEFGKLEQKGIVMTEANQDLIQNYYRKKHNFLFSGVSLHIVVVTNRCNHQCSYCQASSCDLDDKSLDMSIETAKKTVDFIFQTPAKDITIEFQGGEPLLNFDVVKYIVGYALEKNKDCKKDLRFSIVTNLQAMDDSILDYLIDKNVNICTSLDGPESVHNSNRKSTLSGFNSYQNAVKWIKEMRDRGIDNVGALVTVTKASLDKSKEIIDEYLGLGFKDIHLRPCHNMGRALDSDVGVSAHQFIEFYRKSLDYIFELNSKGVKFKERMAHIILTKIFSNYDPNYLDLRSPCGACIGQLAYNFDGGVFSCDEGRMVGSDIFKIGSVDSRYSDVVCSDKSCQIVNYSINDNTSCDECVFKPYCGLCPVLNYVQFNTLVPEFSRSDRCKILFAQFDYLFGKAIELGEEGFKSWFGSKK